MNTSACASDAIYLDYNATTPLEQSVIDTIHSALIQAWGNPSSSHAAGLQAKQLIKESRQYVAAMINGIPEDVIFTSGGTESNNMVLNTALQHFWNSYPDSHHLPAYTRDNLGVKRVLPHIVTSNLEHDSVRLVLEAFQERQKAEVTIVPASKMSGRVEVDDIIAALKPTTCMVTVMLANNETGVIQPVAEIAERIHSIKRVHDYECKILIHTDAAQAIGKIPVNVEDLSVDYLTIVGHKFYGPRIGALYTKGLRRENQLYPMFYGGGQELNYRPGTENTAMIAGLGEAARLVAENLAIYQANMRSVRDYLEEQLMNRFPDAVVINGCYTNSERLPNTCNMSLLGKNLQGNKVLKHLCHTQASTGAACHSATGSRASSILLAIGVQPEVAINAIRLSVGRGTTTSDIDRFIEDIKNAVAKVNNKN